MASVTSQLALAAAPAGGRRRLRRFGWDVFALRPARCWACFKRQGERGSWAGLG